MNSTYQKPDSSRGKFFYFIWRNMPRFFLLAMMAAIVWLFFMVSEKQAVIRAEQEAAISQERPPVNAVVMQVEPGEISERLNLPGSIEAWTSLMLTAEVGGTIEAVLVTEGDSVRQGDILARIEADDYQIALQRAEAAFRLAKADFERDKAVFAQGVIPPAELEARETAMQTAKADLDNANLMLERCRIVAPMDAVIRHLDAKVGAFVSVGDPLALLLHIDKVKAVVGIPESDISAVRRLDELNLTIQALDNLEVVGRRHFVSASPENQARLYRLELEVDNPDHLILPGMFFRADIVKQRREQALAIPFYSIISRNGEQYIFVEKDGVATRRTVETGIMEGWMIEITSGLEPGEQVMIEGHRDAEDGRAVNVVKVITNPQEYLL
jgi:membrane fusion protein (multidrug efflux system)